MCLRKMGGKKTRKKNLNHSIVFMGYLEKLEQQLPNCKYNCIINLNVFSSLTKKNQENFPKSHVKDNRKISKKLTLLYRMKFPIKYKRVSGVGLLKRRVLFICSYIYFFLKTLVKKKRTLSE